MMGHETRRVALLLASVAFLAMPALASPARADGPTGSQATTQTELRPVAVADLAGLELAQPLADLDFLPRILEDYRTGDMVEADILKSKLTDTSALALAEWVAIRSRTTLRFDRVTAFSRDYPDWPTTSLLRRRAEDALLRARRTPDVVRQYFQAQPPISGAGRLALAYAMKAEGADEAAAGLVRKIWREDTFGNELEDKILESFPGVLTQADHRFRMERLLFKESWAPALRAAGLAGKDFGNLVKARIGLYQGGKKAEKAFAAVPASLRGDSSYIFSRALFLRRQDKLLDAVKVMSQAPRDPDLLVDGDEWWAERRLIARKLLDKGEYKAAYEVASHHGAASPSEQIEAEFHAGWIALRFLHQPETAATHFAEAGRIAVTPISVARAAYWQGRAAEEFGNAAEADQFYRRAADKPTTYYGQLARNKLGLPIDLRSPEPLSPDGRKAFDATTPVRALKLLHRLGETELAIGLFTDLGQTLKEPAQLDALGALAAEQNNPRAVLSVGKAAVQRGFPLDLYAYPTMGIPSFNPVGEDVEPAMVYAVARQESAFNPRALSSAGARGLMQLMPATAKRTAERFNLSFDLKRLTDDPGYNATLGSAHLKELMGDWKGSHVLAFASYNAGGGNVLKWIKAYGDPRRPDVDRVDWIERIPFYETRNYVQRVLENLTVYRRRLAQPDRPQGLDPSASANALPPSEPHGD
jgi:soluble lytic murein transglycosylase